jgi:hypothetical protein
MTTNLVSNPETAECSPSTATSGPLQEMFVLDTSGKSTKKEKEQRKKNGYQIRNDNVQREKAFGICKRK